MKKIFFPFILVIFYTQLILGQKIERYIKPDGYRYDNQFMPFADMEHVFALDAKAHEYFRQYKHNKLNAKIMGYTSLALFAGGFVGLAIETGKTNPTTLGPGEFCYTPVFMILASPIALIASISFNTAASASQKKAVDVFNQNQSMDLGGSGKFNLDIRLSNEGLGLSLRF